MRFIGLNEGFRRLFYVVTPNETSYPTLEETPNFINEAIPFFFILIALEFAVKALRKARKEKNVSPYRWNDVFTSVSAGQFLLALKLFLRGVDIVAYAWVYDRFRIYELPWDHAVTWWLGFLGIDFFYYWAHRLGHEVNFFWAAHQTHHSSEYYNLSTALRQSSVHVYSYWLFYLPMAFFIRPSIAFMHMQFNTLYQFWIHTEEIGNLGPLEWILNTPSHHRVHHGRNRYAIDKNYGGTLIIWDRLFGTFAAERDPHTEQLAYGLVHPINTFDGTEVQFIWYKYMFGDLLPRMTTLGDKLRAVFYGPGWTPEAGKRHLRVGDVNDLPDIKGPAEVYNPALSRGLAVYGVVQFVFCVIYYQVLLEVRVEMAKLGWTVSSALLLASGVFYIIRTFTIVGRCMDDEAKHIDSEARRVRYSAAFFGAFTMFSMWQSQSESVLWPSLILFVFNLASVVATRVLQSNHADKSTGGFDVSSKRD